MIRLDNISKQNGHHLLFIEASAALQRGEKVGLVGPNGSGKTTLFRMITGEEQPDEGQLAVDRGMTIGYFSQDVGEMSGHSAVAEVMEGAGPVAAVASELKALEAAMADPDRADEMESIIARYGEVQHRFEELDGGALATYSGNYEFYEEARALAEKQQQAQFERQQAMLAKEIKFIERFKARASHAAQVQSRVKKLDKIERVEPPKRRQTVSFDFPPAPRSGEDVVSLKSVHKGYGSRTIYDGLDFMVRRRERWCVMGINGAGKSTLLKLVAGSTEPDDGTVAVGGSVKMGYFAQHAMDLLH